jgi:carboxylesterase
MLGYIIGFFTAIRVYNELNFFLIKRRNKGIAKILKGAEPFFKKKGKKAALLIHGYTSSPKEFRELGNALAKKNITVYAPLLPGHGTSPERLAVTKYFQWIDTIEESIKMLEQDYDEIYLVGNSFGGNLSIVCANKSKKIKGLVTLGTPIFFHREKINRYLVYPILKRIKLFQRKKYKKNLDKINKRRVAYNSLPLNSIVHMLKVIELSKKEVLKIKVPTLVMQTENDSVAREDSGTFIIDNIKSKNKKLSIVPESYHVFIIDKHRKMANKEILNFIEAGKNKK